jgi:hypothetical protein
MYRAFFCVAFVVTFLNGLAQSDSTVWSFPITHNIQYQGDSIAIVQVMRPDGWDELFRDSQVGLIKRRAVNGQTLDTNMVASGRCYLIKGDYYYFGMRLQKGMKPVVGDLLYSKMKTPKSYNGHLRQLSRHGIGILNLNDEPIFRSMDLWLIMDVADENTLLDSMVADIRYTGKAMKEQMPDNNQLVKGGLFDGKKLFDAMQETTRKELVDFFEYIAAKPRIYAGAAWKISEIFATWMVNETPRVVK